MNIIPTPEQRQFEDYIRNNEDQINWEILWSAYCPSLEFINEYCSLVEWDDICWIHICGCQKLFDQIKVDEIDQRLIGDYFKIFNQTEIPERRDAILDFFDLSRELFKDQNLYRTTRTVSDEFLKMWEHCLDWEMITRTTHMSEEFMESFAEYINWDIVSTFENLSDAFVQKHSGYLDWDTISERDNLSIGFIRMFKEVLNWGLLSAYSNNFDIEHATEFAEFLDWDFLSERVNLSFEFIWEMRDYLDWEQITENYEFDIETARQFQHYLNWVEISTKPTLTVAFLREFAVYLHWDIISRHYSFNEDIAREFMHVIDWEHTSYRKLSENIIRELINLGYLLNWTSLSRMKYLSKRFIREYIHMIDWNAYVRAPNAEPALVYKYIDNCRPSKHLNGVMCRYIAQEEVKKQLMVWGMPLDAINIINEYV